MKIIQCGHCNEKIPFGDASCPACGNESKFAKCPSCGNTVFKTVEKCTLCGESIVTEGVPGKFAKTKNPKEKSDKAPNKQRKRLSKTAKKNILTCIISFVVLAALTLAIFALYPFIDKLVTKASSHKDDKAIIKVAEKYSDAIISRKAKDASKYVYTSDEKSYREDLTRFYDFELMTNKETAKAYKAIADAIVFEIDENSIDSDKNSAEILVNYYIPDYESVIEDPDNLATANAFISAIDKADKDQISMVICLEKDDKGNWLVTNSNAVVNKVYSFVNSGIYIKKHLTSNDISWGCWYYLTDYTNTEYVNTEKINLQLFTTDSASECDIDVYYTVERDGELLFESVNGTFMDLYYGADQGAELEGGFLPTGKYTITLYETTTKEIIYQDSCNVKNGLSIGLSWWGEDYSDYSDVTYTNTDSIELDATLNTFANIYFTVERDGKLLFTSSLINDNTIYGYYDSLHANADDFDSNGNLIAGKYTISFYSKDGTLLASDSCIVKTT